MIKPEISKNVIILAPIFLENEDIKDKEGDDLLFAEKAFTLPVNSNF